MTDDNASAKKASHELSQVQNVDITQRFPQLANINNNDDAQRIEAFQTVLDQLSRELDDIQ